MEQVYIEFTEEPKKLEETLGKLSTLEEFSAFEQKGNSTWMEKRDGDPKLRVDAYFLFPGLFPKYFEENPPTIRISTKSDDNDDIANIAKERVGS